jgi:hypothetical protein
MRNKALNARAANVNVANNVLKANNVIKST